MNLVLISVLFPLVSAILLLLSGFLNLKVRIGNVAVLLSVVQFILVLLAGAGIGESGYPSVSIPWLPQYGINLAFEMSSPAFILMLISALVSISIFSFAAGTLSALHFSLFFVVQAALNGSLTSTNLLVFYFFYELMIFPIFLLLILEHSKELKKAVYKCIIYTLSSSLVMLAAIVFLAVAYSQQTGLDVSFDLKDILKVTLPLQTQQYLLIAFIFAFAVKAPLVPFHSWQPAVYSLSPNIIAVFFSSLLFQIGVFGVYKFCFLLFPAALPGVAPVLAVLGVASILLGSLVAWRELSLRRALAYASIAHIGFSFLGLGSLNYGSVSGAIYLIVTHIVIAAGLFILAAIFERNSCSVNFASVGGIASKAPFFSFFFVCFSLAAVSLPLTASFVGEFLVLNDSFYIYPVLTSLALFGVILGAVYMLNICRQMLFGEERGEFKDLNTAEKTVLVPLLILVLLFGIFPQPILQFINPETKILIDNINRLTSPATSPRLNNPEGRGRSDLQLASYTE